MEPVSAAGLAIGVASIGLQVYTGCIQGIQLLITARNYPDDCKYLNLRLRMEQQRLFVWSETSGLLDLDDNNGDMISKQKKVLESNTFVLHRTTVLDLLVQIQCLFKEFREHQGRHGGLETIAQGGVSRNKGDEDVDLDVHPDVDAARANFPLPARRRDFIRRAMASLRLSEPGAGASMSGPGPIPTAASTASRRLRWVSFDKTAFEVLLARFSTLNDSMAALLDARMQAEIHHAIQDTNRGVLLLHHRVADLGRLVMALNLKLENGAAPPPAYDAAVSMMPGYRQTQMHTPMAEAHKAANQEDLQLLSELAKFKAFNGSIDDSNSMTSSAASLDDATATCLGLGPHQEMTNLVLDRALIELDGADADGNNWWEDQSTRSEGNLRLPDGTRKRVWIEWKDYIDLPPPQRSPSFGSVGSGSQHPRPPKDVIVERVHRLAALLNRGPKPAAFRTPHCLGFFDDDDKTSRAPGAGMDHDLDELQADEPSEFRPQRLGLVFEWPSDDTIDQDLPPISLRDLLRSAGKPSVTARARLARDIANCVLHLHAVDWLHKGLRSHNIIFFQEDVSNSELKNKSVNLEKMYLSGFDFSRPARPDEMTDIPGGDVEHDFYRHPDTQSCVTVDDADLSNTRKSFRKSFDIYSLGVIMIEIALWDTVDRLLGVDLAPGSSDEGIRSTHQHRRRRAQAVVVARKARTRLLDAEIINEVGAAMGEMYQAATKRCIEGGLALGMMTTGEDETNDEVVGRLSVAFYQGVVKKLGEIRV